MIGRTLQKARQNPEWLVKANKEVPSGTDWQVCRHVKYLPPQTGGNTRFQGNAAYLSHSRGFQLGLIFLVRLGRLSNK